MATVSTGHRQTLIAVVSAVLALLFQGAGLSDSPLVLGLAIALFGIPHGAVDHHMMGISGGRRNADLLRYIGALGLVLSVWWFAPNIMLVLFLLNSAWHFGDCDVPNVGRLHTIRALMYGLAVLILMVDPRDPSVKSIIEELLRQPLSLSTFTALDSWRNVAAVIVIILPSMIVHPGIRYRLIRSAIIVALAFSVNSLLAFTWYFTFVHAYTSMNDLRHHLGGRVLWSWGELIRAALPLSLVSYAGIGLAALLLPNTSMMVALFVALSALTLPHSVLFHRVYKVRY
ncbi:MAG: hypothetical protein FGM32_03910 [Candidatus Kapabacteria bacterium]|nr:hypothetical protein [Candidatus Kapabacteria bacterium]